MLMGTLLRRAGAASPLLPAGIYTAILFAMHGSIVLELESRVLTAAAMLLGLLATILLFVIVAWYRYDDWLEAGFIIGITIIVGEWLAEIVVQMIAQRSALPLIAAGPIAVFWVLLRALLVVPISGGLVVLARLLLPPAPKPEAAPGAPERRPKFRFG